MADLNFFTLKYKQAERERKYHQLQDEYFTSAVVLALILAALFGLVYLLIIPQSLALLLLLVFCICFLVTCVLYLHITRVQVCTCTCVSPNSGILMSVSYTCISREVHVCMCCIPTQHVGWYVHGCCLFS
ncbi:adenylate cyclase type 1-like [Talpa occidentalis]|uniref:adenylate cyclase type 1-like n=1 Tax=Talpa occidentalis TaxID=50954 RepID=UPI00189011AF|nr:adenylate cyclase type 1-like [Talpa occidentalis]XP_037371381.1 adenylate cyclase type 1-like [Talpa occidentalis]